MDLKAIWKMSVNYFLSSPPSAGPSWKIRECDRIFSEDEDARRLRLDQGDEALRDAQARNGPPTDAGFSAAFQAAE